MQTHFIDSDVDVILCVPSFVDLKDDFFGSFKTILKEDANIGNMIDVDFNKAPIIKCSINGVLFDISCALISSK